MDREYEMRVSIQQIYETPRILKNFGDDNLEKNNKRKRSDPPTHTPCFLGNEEFINARCSSKNERLVRDEYNVKKKLIEKLKAIERHNTKYNIVCNKDKLPTNATSRPNEKTDIEFVERYTGKNMKILEREENDSLHLSCAIDSIISCLLASTVFFKKNTGLPEFVSRDIESELYVENREELLKLPLISILSLCGKPDFINLELEETYHAVQTFIWSICVNESNEKKTYFMQDAFELLMKTFENSQIDGKCKKDMTHNLFVNNILKTKDESKVRKVFHIVEMKKDFRKISTYYYGQKNNGNKKDSNLKAFMRYIMFYHDCIKYGLNGDVKEDKLYKREYYESNIRREMNSYINKYMRFHFHEFYVNSLNLEETYRYFSREKNKKISFHSDEENYNFDTSNYILDDEETSNTNKWVSKLIYHTYGTGESSISSYMPTLCLVDQVENLIFSKKTLKSKCTFKENITESHYFEEFMNMFQKIVEFGSERMVMRLTQKFHFKTREEKENLEKLDFNNFNFIKTTTFESIRKKNTCQKITQSLSTITVDKTISFIKKTIKEDEKFDDIIKSLNEQSKDNQSNNFESELKTDIFMFGIENIKKNITLRVNQSFENVNSDMCSLSTITLYTRFADLLSSRFKNKSIYIPSDKIYLTKRACNEEDSLLKGDQIELVSLCYNEFHVLYQNLKNSNSIKETEYLFNMDQEKNEIPHCSFSTKNGKKHFISQRFLKYFMKDYQTPCIFSIDCSDYEIFLYYLGPIESRTSTMFQKTTNRDYSIHIPTGIILHNNDHFISLLFLENDYGTPFYRDKDKIRVNSSDKKNILNQLYKNNEWYVYNNVSNDYYSPQNVKFSDQKKNHNIPKRNNPVNYPNNSNYICQKQFKKTYCRTTRIRHYIDDNFEIINIHGEPFLLIKNNSFINLNTIFYTTVFQN